MRGVETAMTWEKLEMSLIKWPNRKNFACAIPLDSLKRFQNLVIGGVACQIVDFSDLHVKFLDGTIVWVNVNQMLSPFVIILNLDPWATSWF